MFVLLIFPIFVTHSLSYFFIALYFLSFFLVYNEYIKSSILLQIHLRNYKTYTLFRLYLLLNIFPTSKMQTGGIITTIPNNHSSHIRQSCNTPPYRYLVATLLAFPRPHLLVIEWRRALPANPSALMGLTLPNTIGLRTVQRFHKAPFVFLKNRV